MAAVNSFDMVSIAKQKSYKRIGMNSTISNINSQQLNLKNFISKKNLEYLATDCERFRIFDPVSTLYCFLYQVLTQCSSKSALANFNVQRSKLGMKLTSMNTSAFTKAKKRLSESKLLEILRATGKEIDKNASNWNWKNKDVYLVDGTIINLEDTKKIKDEYPLTFAKGKAQGQPKLRLLGLFSLSSGAFLDGEIGKYSGKGQSETTMIQRMLSRIKPRSVLILDRFFTSYFLQNQFLDSKIDYVIRGRDNFVKKNLGRRQDKIVELKSPSLSKYPSYKGKIYRKAIKVRFIKSSIKREGFRAATIYIMTSFLDQQKYSKFDIEKLYLARWGVELDIRNLKCTLDASQLRSKCPKMIRKELWVSLLAYNLVRSINVKVANIYENYSPRKRSFKTALKSYIEVINSIGSKGIGLLFEILSKETLNAKYRREPRAIKKRVHRYSYLTVSRKISQKQNWGYGRRKGRMGLSKATEA